MDQIAVLIPCYNEAKTISKVIRDWKQELPEAVIYVYDNNSADNTAELAKSAGAIVRKERKQGKGNVIRRMLREVDAECYVMTDGDDTYCAACGRTMVNLVLAQQLDMVVGDRLSSTYFTQNKRPFHNQGNALVRSCINYLFHCDIKDIMTGCRAFSYEFAKSFPVLSTGFEIETEMSIHAVDKNMAIQNIAIGYQDRPEGSVSKLHTYTDGIRVLKTIAKLFRIYKPMAFFGILALTLLAISAIMLLPVMYHYIKTGLVPRFPTLIVCGFIAIAALQSLFSGLILSTINNREKQEFEFRLQLITMEKKLRS